MGVIFFCAIFLRVYRLAQIPDILQLDEAGLSYNAWCLVHYGTDRYLNIHPFYAQNFEGGQSPLYTYLLVLLIKTLGQGNISLWLTRLPAVLASILLFLTGVKTISCIFHDRKFHIAAACFLAFCPYYIMSGRLALDCNLMLCCSAVSLLLLTCSYFLWTASFINYYFNIYAITDHYPSSLYNIPIKDAVDYAESHANFLTLYMDCTGMSEFYFFYYPVDSSTITSEEHYQNGSHGYEFWVDYYATPVESSNAYIVRKENWEFINKLNASGLSFQTVEYPHYYLFYFE